MIARIVTAETRAEFLKLVRLPGYVIPSVGFPALFYAVFGLVFGGRPAGGGLTMAAYMVATYGTFGVAGAALFGLGVGVATERAQGWLTLKRASPMPPAAYFAAKVAMSMLFALVIGLLLSIMAATVGHVRLDAWRWLGVLATLVVGAAPFCALGCAIAYLVGPNTAPAIVNLVYLPMSLASGLLIPVEVLPRSVQAVSSFLPPFHLARLALGVMGIDESPAWPHVAALVAFTAFFFLLAIAAYRRDDGKVYG